MKTVFFFFKSSSRSNKIEGEVSDITNIQRNTNMMKDTFIVKLWRNMLWSSFLPSFNGFKPSFVRILKECISIDTNWNHFEYDVKHGMLCD